LPASMTFRSARAIAFYHWPIGRRPDDHTSLSDLGL
jgi:nuclear transport factor 2 (NTF2) superfamily protein